MSNFVPLHPRCPRVVLPSVPVVTLAEIKNHCRVEIDDDDDNLEEAVEAATRVLEERLSRAFINTTFDYTIDYFPCQAIKLPYASVSSIVSIVYRDANGNATTIDTGDYHLSSGTPGYVEPILGSVWPASSPSITGSITIRFVAGYGADASTVPATIKRAVKNLAGHLYRQRESVSTVNQVEVPQTVDALLDSERWY